MVSDDAEGHSLIEDGQVTTGCSIAAFGQLVESPGGKQAIELKASNLKLIGVLRHVLKIKESWKGVKQRILCRCHSHTTLLGVLCIEDCCFAALLRANCTRMQVPVTRLHILYRRNGTHWSSCAALRICEQEPIRSVPSHVSALPWPRRHTISSPHRDFFTYTRQ